MKNTRLPCTCIESCTAGPPKAENCLALLYTAQHCTWETAGSACVSTSARSCSQHGKALQSYNIPLQALENQSIVVCTRTLQKKSSAPGSALALLPLFLHRLLGLQLSAAGFSGRALRQKLHRGAPLFLQPVSGGLRLAAAHLPFCIWCSVRRCSPPSCRVLQEGLDSLVCKALRGFFLLLLPLCSLLLLHFQHSFLLCKLQLGILDLALLLLQSVFVEMVQKQQRTCRAFFPQPFAVCRQCADGPLQILAAMMSAVIYAPICKGLSAHCLQTAKGCMKKSSASARLLLHHLHKNTPANDTSACKLHFSTLHPGTSATASSASPGGTSPWACTCMACCYSKTLLSASALLLAFCLQN